MRLNLTDSEEVYNGNRQEGWRASSVSGKSLLYGRIQCHLMPFVVTNITIGIYFYLPKYGNGVEYEDQLRLAGILSNSGQT